MSTPVCLTLVSQRMHNNAGVNDSSQLVPIRIIRGEWYMVIHLNRLQLASKTSIQVTATTKQKAL